MCRSSIGTCEIGLLTERLTGLDAELLVVYGRRRTGKTEQLSHLATGHRSLFVEATDSVAADRLRDLGVELSRVWDQRAFLADELASSMEPFTARGAGLFQPGYNPLDRIRTYAVCGGIPYYLERFRDHRSLSENLLAEVFRRTGLLHDEAGLMLPARTPRACPRHQAAGLAETPGPGGADASDHGVAQGPQDATLRERDRGGAVVGPGPNGERAPVRGAGDRRRRRRREPAAARARHV